MLLRARQRFSADPDTYHWADPQASHGACADISNPFYYLGLDGDESLENVVSHLDAAFSRLWTQQWVSKDDTLYDPTIRFCAYYSLNADGSYVPAKGITPIFAQFKYHVRLYFLSVFHEQDEDAWDSVPEFQPWFTDNGSASTYSSLCNWQHIASNIVWQESPIPKIHWIDRQGWTSFRYGGHIVTLDGLQALFRQTEDDLVRVWEDEVLLGLPLRVDTTNLTEDMSIRTPGYSFLTDPRNNLAKYNTLLFSTMQANPTLYNRFTVVRDGKRYWRPHELNRWIEQYAKLSMLLLLRIEMLSGGPARGTELTSMVYCSTAEQPLRNVSLLDKYVMLLATYSKTTARSGLDRIIPHAIDSVTADILLQSLILARPFAIMAVDASHPNHPQYVQLYHHYLFVNGTKLFQTTDISLKMRVYGETHTGLALTIALFRQLFVAWRRKLCPNATYIMENEHEDHVAAEQAGHSWAVEKKLYGISADAFAGASEDMLVVFLIASANWQTAQRVVPGTSLLSLRLNVAHPCAGGLGLAYPDARHTLFDGLVEEGVIQLEPPNKGIEVNVDLDALADKFYAKVSSPEFLSALTSAAISSGDITKPITETIQDVVTSSLERSLAKNVEPTLVAAVERAVAPALDNALAAIIERVMVQTMPRAVNTAMEETLTRLTELMSAATCRSVASRPMHSQLIVHWRRHAAIEPPQAASAPRSVTTDRRAPEAATTFHRNESSSRATPAPRVVHELAPLPDAVTDDALAAQIPPSHAYVSSAVSCAAPEYSWCMNAT